VFVTVNWEFIFGNFMEHILFINGDGLNVAIMGKSHCVMNEYPAVCGIFTRCYYEHITNWGEFIVWNLVEHFLFGRLLV
jgi:hypothetical protein